MEYNGFCGLFQQFQSFGPKSLLERATGNRLKYYLHRVTAMAPFSTLLHDLSHCLRLQQKAPKQPSLMKLNFLPKMTKTIEIRSFGSFSENETVVKTRDSKIKMATVFNKTVNQQLRAINQSDQLTGAEVLLSKWLKCQSEKQNDSSDCETERSKEKHLSDEGVAEMPSETRELWESFLNNSDLYNPLHSNSIQVPSRHQERDNTEWSEEIDSDWSDEGDSEMSVENRELWESFLNNSDLYNPLHSNSIQVPSRHQERDHTEWSEEEDSDWSDEGDSEMSVENRELWESFLNNSDPYNPLHFTCPTEDKVKASDNDHDDYDYEEEEEEVSPSHQERDNTEWSEEEDSDWSDEGDSEMSEENRELWESFNSDPYNPLSFSCPIGVKIKASEIQQNHTLPSPTAREVEEHNPEQSTKKREKKVCFSEEVTIHTLEAWGFASQEARDGSCWMEMARDRDRFKRRVEKAGEVISPCLTAQHRARVLNRLLNPSVSSLADQ